MLSQNEFLTNVVEKLQQTGIDYVICGSMAATFYGVTRSTQDADIIINPTKEQLAKFVELLGDAYYVSKDTALEALEQGDMFNIIEVENAYKADLIIRKQSAFSAEEFCRKRKENLLGKDLYILSPEDSILSKLVWAKQSRSEMQYRDIMTILETRAGRLDMNYLDKWSKILNVEDDLNKCLSQIDDLRQK
jgi:hypothetical protein